MAGITALAATGSVPAGSTAVDKNASGFLTAEQIVLGASPTGASYSWGLSKPQGATARSDLNSLTDATPTFTPDVAGVYNITCTVDSTAYTLRLTVTQLAQSTPLEAVRFSPVADSAAQAPALGWATYFSETLGTWVAKNASGVIVPLRPGDVGAALSDADATIQAGDGSIRAALSGTLTQNRSITLGTSGASAGHVIEIARYDVTAFTLAIINGGAGAGTLHTFPVSETGWAKFKFGGTNWTLDELRPLS